LLQKQCEEVTSVEKCTTILDTRPSMIEDFTAFISVISKSVTTNGYRTSPT